MSIPRNARPERNATATAGHPAVASTRTVSQFAERISALEHMFTPPPPPVFHKFVREIAAPSRIADYSGPQSLAAGFELPASTAPHTHRDFVPALSMRVNRTSYSAGNGGLHDADTYKRGGF